MTTKHKIPDAVIEVARQFGSAEAQRKDRERRPRMKRDWLWHACDKCWRTSDHEFIYQQGGYGKPKEFYCLGHLPDKFARGYMLKWHQNRREYAYYRLARWRLWRDAHPRDTR